MKPTMHSNRGFTLIELLVVVAVLAILLGLGTSAISAAMGKGKIAAEVSAAKSLVAAYQAATADNDGRYLPAYDGGASNVNNASGKPLSMKESKSRYPWRLAPYLGYALKGSFLVGGNEEQFMKVMEIKSRDSSLYDYGVSIFPALGINRSYVGGHILSNGKYDTNITAPDCIRTVVGGDRSVIVFVSAGADGVDGYEYVKAPGAPDASWSTGEWTDKSNPGDFGYVHPRHDGKAVAAFLDGSVRMLGLGELRDMRLWSRDAAMQDDPHHKTRAQN